MSTITISMFVFNLLICSLMIPSSLNAAGITPCPDCGSMHVPYPLSTGDGCGDPSYRVHCNSNKKLELGVLNGTSYPILSINPGSQRLIIQPAPLLPDVCATEDLRSEGILLNKSLPFNITSSNTLMLLNCSPRLLLSPLNCTSSSLCHQYIDQVEEAKPCRSSGLCCTFVAGGSSSSYKIHVWNRGCRAYRSIVNVNPALPARQWTKGVELQWVSPREPSCESQRNCGPNSSCLQDRKSGGSRCLCNTHFRWDPISGTCAKRFNSDKSVCRTRGGCHRRAPLVAALVSGLFAAIAGTIVLILIYRRKKLLREAQAGLAKQRADILSANSGGKSARIFSSKEVKKATNGFSKDRILGSGGFGEVYKGVLEDGKSTSSKLSAFFLVIKQELHRQAREQYYDLKVGSGLEAVKGSRVAVHYVAKWKGVTFMTSRQGLGVTGGTPYGFDVGASENGSVLKGLDLGVQGMRVGGQRLLIVPPDLAYGNKGVQEIPPNATLEFDLELLSIKQSPFGSSVKIIEG